MAIKQEASVAIVTVRGEEKEVYRVDEWFDGLFYVCHTIEGKKKLFFKLENADDFTDNYLIDYIESMGWEK